MESTPYLKLVFAADGKPSDYKLEIAHAIDDDLLTYRTDYEIVKDQTLFLLPGSLIEQQKFKILSEKFGFKKTNDISKADVILRGPKTPYLKNITIFNVTMISNNVQRDIIERASNYHDEKINAFIRSQGSRINLIVPLYSTWEAKGEFLKNHNLHRYSTNNWHQRSVIIKSEPFSINSHIYDDSPLIEHQINRKGIIFDQETCLNIGRMLKSPDTENRELILELLSNCDYNESALYILVLIKEFQWEFARLPTTRKAFKAMLAYLNIDRKRIGFLTTDDIIHSLKSMNKYTAKHLEQLVAIQKHLVSFTIGADTITTTCINDAEELDL